MERNDLKRETDADTEGEAVKKEMTGRKTRNTDCDSCDLWARTPQRRFFSAFLFNQTLETQLRLKSL